MAVSRVPDDRTVGISNANPTTKLIPYKCAPGNVVVPPYDPQPVNNYYLNQQQAPQSVYVDQTTNPFYYVDESQYINQPGSTPSSQSPASAQQSAQVQQPVQVVQPAQAVVAQAQQQLWNAIWQQMPQVFAQLIAPIEQRNAMILPQVLQEMNRAANILNDQGNIDVRRAWIDEVQGRKADIKYIYTIDVSATSVGAEGKPVTNIYVDNLYLFEILVITSDSATAFAVGRLGLVNPVFQVNAAAANAAAGIEIAGGAAGDCAAITVISSATDECLKINAKNAGQVFIANSSTGAITLGTATNCSSTLHVVSNFDVGTTSFTVAAATGNTSVAGTLHAGGNFDVGTTMFTVAAASGNTTIAGTLGVTGAVTGASFTGVGTGLTALNASNLASGTVPTACLGSGTANSTTYLRGDSTWVTVSGAGDVVGPASATDNAVARYDGTTGKLIQDSGVIVSDSNNVTGIADLTMSGALTVNGVTFASVLSRLTALEAFSSVTDVNYNTSTGVLKQTKSTPIGSPSDSTIDTAEAC